MGELDLGIFVYPFADEMQRDTYLHIQVLKIPFLPPPTD
jgi:hypothetical protein